MNTADSLASGALGAAVAALVWLIGHSAQIKRVLELLPRVAADAATAKAAVETTGLKAELDAESKVLLARLLARLEAGDTTTPGA